MRKSELEAKRHLKIAILGSRGIPTTYSGYEVFVRELAPRLASRGHQVTVYCRRSLFTDRPKYFNGVRLVYLPSIETKELSTLSHTLFSAVDALFRRVDVTLVVNIGNAFHCLIPRLFGREVAINVDGLDWKRGKWGALARKYFFLNAKFVGRICPRGVVTDAREMQRIYQEEFNTRSTFVAYGAELQTSNNPEALRKYGLRPFQYYLILSRMVPENNADLIIRAFERVRTPRLLAIAGDANYRSDFVDRIKRTRDPRVRFIGHIGHPDDVKELHCNAYAYVHGHSLGGTNPSLLTALGCGNCVLALKTPFSQEILQDYGILFESAPAHLTEKIQFIDDHPEIAQRYRVRAPQRIREAYTWDHITNQYEELFLLLASGQDPTRVHSSLGVQSLVSEQTTTAGVAADD